MITGTDLSAARSSPARARRSRRNSCRACAGEIQTAFALTEPEAGSDVRGLASVARRQGDDYVLDGRKKFITRANTADWLMVIARLADDAGAPGDKFVGLLVPKGAPGLKISAEVAKLGWFGVPICSIEFDKVRVPATHRLGDEGDGF